MLCPREQASVGGVPGVCLRDVLSERRDLAEIFHGSVVDLACIENVMVVALEGGAWLLVVLWRLSCVSPPLLSGRRMSPALR